MSEEVAEVETTSEPVAAPAPVAAAPAPAANVKITTTEPPAAPPPEDKAYWPADWREKAAKEDAKIKSRLDRYASPEAAIEALIAAQNRISKGELKPVLGKDATPEQIKEWRDAHGIPEAPDKYTLKDVKVDHLDKEVLGTVLKAAHESNQTPEQISATLKAWNAIEQAALEKRSEADLEVQKKAEDALREEWGGEYRRNINLIHNLLDGSGSQDLKDKLLNGRLADGTPIGSSPEALKMLVGLALIQNPTGVVVPGNEANQAKGIKEELDKIKETMRTNRKAYDKDEHMQKRFGDLLGAASKMNLIDDNGNWKA